jgi:prevent-host-death family protein
LKGGAKVYIQLSELKANPAKYFDLSKTTDVFVTRHGKRLGRIVCEEKAAKTAREIAFVEMMDLVRKTPSAPDDTVYDPIKEERLRERGLL